MATVVLPLHAGEANGLYDQKETVIELKDAVTVLNENSRFQINLLLADFPTEMITLPIPVQELKNLTNASQESIADLLEHASNHTAAVSNGVFTLLPRGDASVVRRDHRPEIVDSEHWKVADMPIVTASFTNQTVREILSALVNPHRKAYWIAWPLHDEMALREAVQIAPGGLMPDQATFLSFERAMTKALQVGGKTNVMSVGIYHAMENRHVSLPLGK